jgi:hypothetical protein
MAQVDLMSPYASRPMVAPEQKRSLRMASVPLLLLSAGLAAVAVLSATPAAALAALPVLLLIVARLLGARLGEDAVVALLERRATPKPAAAARPPWPSLPEIRPAIERLASGRPLRGPPGGIALRVVSACSA